MNMVPYDIEKLGGINAFKQSKSCNMDLILAFAESEYDCVEVKNFPQKSASVCVTGLTKAIERMRMNTVKVTRRGNRVFLLRRKDI